MTCLNAWDTNKSLEKTFRFIKDNQIDSNGNPLETILYLANSLRQNQSFEIYNNRDYVFNIIYGKVIKVKENYLVMEVVSDCTGESQLYTVAYSDIPTFRSFAITAYYDKYIAFMDTLPPICKDCGNKYYNILEAFSKTVSETSPSNYIYSIYAGIFSLGYLPSSYYIARNLIIVEKNAVLPITSSSGFFTAPAKSSKEDDKIKEASLLDLSKKEGF